MSSKMRYGAAAAALVVVIVLAAVLSLRELRTERVLDRSGYVSLTYELDAGGSIAPDAAGVVERLEASVLARPGRRLLWRVVDPNHIELRMTLPRPHVQRLREAYYVASRALVGVNLAGAPLESSLSSTKGRTQRLEFLAAGDPERLRRLTVAAAAYDAWRSASDYMECPEDVNEVVLGVGTIDFRILAEPDAADPNASDGFRAQLGRRGTIPAPGDPLAWFRIDNPEAFLGLSSPAELEALDVRTVSQYVVERWQGEYFVLAETTPQDVLLSSQGGWKIENVGESRDQRGRPSLSVSFNRAGGQLLGDLTERNVDKPLGVFVGDEAITAAVVRSRLSSCIEITGDFADEKLRYLVQMFNVAGLPLHLKRLPVERIVPPAGRWWP
jgi:hypothetical protein